MNKPTWIGITVGLVIISFLIGLIVSPNESGLEIQNQLQSISEENDELQLLVAQLESSNTELQQQIKELQSLEAPEDQCRQIKDEADSYVQQFQQVSCSSHNDCVKVDPPASCGVCVHTSIDQDQLQGHNGQFGSTGCSEQSDYMVGCPAVVTWCGCIENVCTTTFTPPQ